MVWRVISSVKIPLPVVVGVIATCVTFFIAVVYPNNFYKVWETASVAFTAGFAAVTWHRWFKKNDGIGLFVEHRIIGRTVLCYIGLVAGVVLVFLFIWVEPVRLWPGLDSFWLAYHCAALLLCAACGARMDHFAANAKVRSGMGKRAKQSTVFQNERRMAFVAFRYADLPTIGALVLIGMFMVVFACKHPGTTTQLNAFLAGAVSFELISSNVVFEMAKRQA